MCNATLICSSNREISFVSRAEKLITCLSNFIHTNKSKNFLKDLEKIEPNFNLFNDVALVTNINRQAKDLDLSQIVFLLYCHAEREMVTSNARLDVENREKWQGLVAILDVVCDLVEEKVSEINDDDYCLIY